MNSIEIPFAFLVTLVLLCCASLSLVRIYSAMLRQVLAEPELYVEDSKGECDVPREALKCSR
ncbi:hypothetical protein P0Y35_08660 [Kiritimatiellaeota bacterium B1221]|nr:hypothetical protein [Kiritimatiellaeota bacterium B1221]